MAKDNEIIIRLVTDGKGVKILTQDTAKLAKETDKTSKSQKKLGKNQEVVIKGQKGLAQAGMNTTKGFSKMNQMLGSGGSSGLVAAYATLAANVFAASAMFLALRNAAQFEQLKIGLEELGNASGRTLSVMAQGLRDVTGGAISAQEAMTAAALGVSGGFGGEELKGLAKIAKGASITLGRDLGDAFDRLTRGAIKLEPEILDELGIMVRLDDATEQYAAQLGKTAGALSQAERRQAFMNAILEQGEAKFGDIAESVDATAYDKLGATFADLTKNIFSFINEGLGLNHLIGFLADNMAILAGVAIVFGSTIVNTMLPGLANAAAGAARMAEQALVAAEAQEHMAESALLLGREQVGAFEMGSKPFKDFQKQMVAGTKNTDIHRKAIGKLNQGLGGLKATGATLSGAKAKENAIAIAGYEAEIARIEQLIVLEQARGRAAQAAAASRIAANSAAAISDITTMFTAGAAGFGTSVVAIWKNMGTEIKALMKHAGAGGKTIGLFGKSMIRSSAAGKAFMGVMRLVGATLLNFALPIGILVIALGTLYWAFNRAYNTKEMKAYVKGVNELDKIIEALPGKAEKYREQMDKVGPSNLKQITQFQIISGSLDEMNAKMMEQIRLRKEADKSRPKPVSLGMTEKEASNAMDRITQDTYTHYEQFGTRDIQTTRKRTDAEKQRSATKALGGTSMEELGLDFDDLGTDKLQKQMKEIFAIRDSDEYKSFSAILTSEIPGQAALVKRYLNLDEPINESTISAEDFQVALNKAAAVSTMLGKSAKSVSQQMQAAEKSASAFVQALSPKTSVDTLVQATDGIVKELNTLKETMKQVFKEEGTEGIEGLSDGITEMGKAMSGTGSQMASLMGGTFQEDLAAVTAAEKDILDTKLAGGEVNQTQKDHLEDMLGKLGSHHKEYKSTLKTLREMQREEILRKQNLAQMDRLIKGMAPHMLKSKAAAAATRQFEKERLVYEKASATANIKMLTKTFQRNKATKSIAEGLKNGKMSMEDAVDLAVAQGVATENVFALIKQINEERRIGNEQKLAEMNEEHQMLLDNAKVELKTLEVARELAKIKEGTAVSEARIASFKGGNLTGTDTADSQKLKVDAAKAAYDHQVATAALQETMAVAQLAMDQAHLEMLNAEYKLKFNKDMEGYDQIKGDLETAKNDAKKSITAITADLKEKLKVAVLEGFSVAAAFAAEGDVFSALENALKAAMNPEGLDGEAISTAEAFGLVQLQMEGFKQSLMEMGPEGEKYAAFVGGMQAITSMVQVFGDENSTAAEKVKAVSGTLTAIGSAIMASSKAASAEIDNQIEAEEKRDGKSKESLAKIKALKMKQYQIEKKAFEQNKKIQLANAVINGLAAIQSGFATTPFFPLGIAMGLMAVGMTAMQIKSIKSQQFGAPPSDSAAVPQEISVGKRDNRVDTSMGTTSGELAYLRGSKGIGSTANKFAPGGAAGMRRSYANGGEILVGERGPEVVEAREGGYNVVPNDRIGGQNLTANITINAIDAAGVEEVITAQKGHIIGMIRAAAHEHGEEFIEAVDPNVYGVPLEK